MGTEFTIFDKGAKPGRVEIDPNRSSDSSEAQYSSNNATAPGQLPPRTELGAVRYEYNVLGTKGPRVMSGAIPKVDPVSLRRGTALRAFPNQAAHCGEARLRVTVCSYTRSERLTLFVNNHTGVRH